MEVYSYRQMARDKASRIKDGMCAYAETEMMAHLIKKELKHQNLQAYEDSTDIGCFGLSLYASNPFLHDKKRERGLEAPLSHDDDLHTSSKSRKISSATAQS
nr:hypothetical protein [Bacillus pumilus]